MVDTRNALGLAAEADRRGGLCGRCGRALAPGEPVWHGRVAWANNVSYWRWQRIPICRACMEALAADKGFRQDNPGWRRPRPCEHCGRSVVKLLIGHQRLGYHYFCCLRCEWNWRNGRRRRWTRAARAKVCPVCSREFTGSRTDSVYDTPACRQRAYRRRGRDS